MRKIMLILICIFSVTCFVNRVNAIDEDHSLNYDIETFKVEDGVITIEGWAFIHNYDNYGDMPNDSYSYYNYINKNITKDARLKLYFYFESGSKKIGITSAGETLFNAKFAGGRDLTYVMCYKSGNSCANNDQYVYYNVGFSATFSLKDYVEQMENSTWNLKIGAKLLNGQAIEDDLAIDSYIADVKSDNSFEVSGLGNSIDVIGNHVVLNEHDVEYWKLNVNDNYLYAPSMTRQMDGIHQYYLYYKLGKHFYSIYDKPSACNFEHRTGYTSGDCSEVCNPVSENCFGAYIYSTFVKPSGHVSVKYKGGEVKYCAALNNDASISDCEGATEYSCNAMTVKSGNISADVAVSEHAELSQDQYYPSIIIPAGSGFKYGATYVDTVTWKIVKRNYDGNTYDNEICKLLTEGNKYYNKISLKDKIIISDKFNLNSDGSPNNENLGKAGYWTEKWETGNCSITHTLKYVIGKASYNIKQSKIEYSSTVEGGVYYLPLKMCIVGSNEGVFSWNVTSTGNVASAKVRTGKKENNIQSVQFDINTGISGGGSACKILVKKSLHDCESTSSTYSGDSTSLKYLPVYRTIDEKFAFPKSRPDNWVDYANKVNAKDINSIPRITNILDYYHSSDSEKYAMDEYVTQVITKSLIKNYLNNASYNGSYSSWDDINNVGKNNTIITSDTYFAKRATKICKIGEYSRECDTQ